MAVTVDLNADVGESYGRWRLGDDDALLEVVCSANVACGFHAGDPLTLLRTCRAAVGHGLVIGAQVGYADLRGFGRRFIDVPPPELTADVTYQIGALDGLARSVGGSVAYVKPHGALYHATIHHRAQARAVVAGVRAYRDDLVLLGFPGSLLLEEAAGAGLPVAVEGFADRAYAPDGTLVSRDEPGAVLAASDAAAQAVRLASEVDSLCLHGDTAGAVDLARTVREALESSGVQVRPFLDGG